ncbi:MAG: lamin tail domain-containing protein [Candidatus Paceibacteria bacterium]
MSRLLLILLLFLAPAHLLFASVSISEIAWMGSTQSANHEWIELFNSGESVSVEGWTLSDGNNLNITLTGTIPASTYVVLERNRSDGGSVVGTPFLNYSGALVNTGATLTLRRADGGVVDSVAGGENWQLIGGDNTTKDTAQYTSSGWITGVPTPGRVNTTVASSPPAGAGSSGTSNSLTVLYGSTATPVTATALPVSDTLSVQISAPTFIYEGQPVSFKAIPSGLGQTIRNSLVYQWNFGDLHTATSVSPTHTYAYPGTYNVVVEAHYASYHTFARVEVAVLPMTVSLSHSSKGDVLLQNDAMYEVDISGYQLVATKAKTIPSHTYISPRETITIPWQAVSESPFPAVVLFGRGRELITSTNSSSRAGESTISAVVTSPTTAQPVAMSTSAVGIGEESMLLIPSAFGFATAQAYEDEIEILKIEEMIESDGEASDAVGVTPVLPLATTSPSQIPPLSTWWVYGVFIIVLAGSMASILLRPKK